MENRTLKMHIANILAIFTVIFILAGCVIV